MQRAIFITFASALTLAALQPSSALADETRSTRVSLAGLDLSSDVGAGEAVRRINDAALNVCDLRTGPQLLEARAATRECARDAVQNAVANLNNPNVSARFERQGESVLASR